MTALISRAHGLNSQPPTTRRLNTYDTVSAVWDEEQLRLAKTVDVVALASPSAVKTWTERSEFLIDNLLVRIHFTIPIIRWPGLAPWEFESPFPGSFTSTLRQERGCGLREFCSPRILGVT